ncbi:hypothetical protein GE061_015370 [Apolygus lucorum]|uniref:C2H2-type domain-containing protein n=1 Tax=Apolygus lucorum TaxID=248454 RepID=A0A8S9XKS5_APOLU|nr:hypothetical protein GE061_015370 [Apolygus lucorum]
MSQVATSEIKQPRKRGRPRKYPKGMDSYCLKLASSAATKKEILSNFSPATHLVKTFDLQEWRNKSAQEKMKHYRLTSGLKKFVTSCTPISVELWEAFRTDHRNTCGLCGSVVGGTDVLKEHILNHVFLKCLICKAYFNKLDSFKSHIQLHSSEKSVPYKCGEGVLPCSSEILNLKNSEESSNDDQKSIHNVEPMTDNQLNVVQDDDKWDSCGNRQAMSELLRDGESIGVGRSMPDLDFEEEELITEGCSSSCLDNALNELHPIQGTEDTNENNRIKGLEFGVPNFDNVAPNRENPSDSLDETLSMQNPKNTSKNILDIPCPFPNLVPDLINRVQPVQLADSSSKTKSSEGRDCLLSATIDLCSSDVPDINPFGCLDEVRSAQLADNSSEKKRREVHDDSDMITSTPSTSKTTTPCSKRKFQNQPNHKSHSNIRRSSCNIDTNDMGIAEKCPSPSQESKRSKPLPGDHATFCNSEKGARKRDLEIIVIDSESENSTADQQLASSNIETIICDDSSDSVGFVTKTFFKVPKPIKSVEFSSKMENEKPENKEPLIMSRFPAPINQSISQPVIVLDDEIDLRRHSVATNQEVSQTISLLDDDIEMPRFQAPIDQNASQTVSLLVEKMRDVVFNDLIVSDDSDLEVGQDPGSKPVVSGKKSEVPETVSNVLSLDKQPAESKNKNAKCKSKISIEKFTSDSKHQKLQSGSTKKVRQAPKSKTSGSGKTGKVSETVSKQGLPAETAKCGTKASIEKSSPESKLGKLYYSTACVEESEVIGQVSNDLSLDEQRATKRRRRYTKRSSKASIKRSSSESSHPSGPKASVNTTKKLPLDEPLAKKRKKYAKLTSKVTTNKSCPPGSGKESEMVSNELSLNKQPPKRRKRSNKCAASTDQTNRRRKKSIGRVSKNELKSLFCDFSKSSADIAPVTPPTAQRVTRRSVSSSTKSDACNTVSSSSKIPRIIEKESSGNSSEGSFLTRLYVEKNDNVPKAASIKIEMLESQTSRSHKKTPQRVPRTIISGKDFKSFSWVVPFASTPTYLANDRQWKKLLDVAKASNSSTRLNESESDSDVNQWLETVIDDVSDTQIKSAEMDISMAELTNFEVVDVGNFGECSPANDSPLSRDKDPLAINLEDAAESDHIEDESDESLAAPKVVQSPNAKAIFDQDRFVARSASTSTILMDDIPELVDGQWFVRYIVYYRLKKKLDRIMSFPNKESFFLSFKNDEVEKIPKNAIVENSAYFCDYRGGNNITIRLGEPLTKLGSGFSNPTSETIDSKVPKNGDTGQQGIDISSNSNRSSNKTDAILGGCENHGSNPDNHVSSVNVDDCSTNVDLKEKMTLEMEILSSNEVLGKFLSSAMEPNDWDNSPLKDGDSLSQAGKFNSSIASNEGGTSPVLVTRNIKTLRSSSKSGYWGFSDTESETEQIEANTSISPNRDKIDTDKECSDETDKEHLSVHETNRKNRLTPWEKLTEDLKKIDKEVPVATPVTTPFSSSGSTEPRKKIVSLSMHDGSLSPDYVDDIILQSLHSSDGSSHADPDQVSRQEHDCTSPPLLHFSDDYVESD